MTFILTNCVSTDKTLGKYGREESLFRVRSSDVLTDQVTLFPSETGTPKTLPELTGDDYERLGDVYFSKGDSVMAFVQYEKSLRLTPDNTRIHYKKGLLFVFEGMNEDAIEEFQKVLEKEPEHTLAHNGLGQAFFQVKKYDGAEKHLRKAIELDSSLWKSHNLLGILCDYRRQHEVAIKEYETAIALNPDNELIYNNLGISYSMAEEYEKAINAFNKALEIESSYGKIYNNLGVVLSKLGRYQEALEAFRKGGDESQAYNNLGCIYLWKGEYEKAIQFFEKAIVLKPDFYDKANENLKRCRIAQLHELSFDSNTRTPADLTSSEKFMKAITSSQPKGDLVPYKVKKGDSPFSIANSHNMKLSDFLELNNLTSTSTIYPNQTLLMRIK